MATYSDSVYKTFLEALKNEGWYKEFIDDINNQYNNTDWRSFAEVMPQQLSRTWHALLDETEISVMASAVSDLSPTPLRAVKGVSQKYGSIPTFGHGFEIGVLELRAIREANYSEDATLEFLKRKYRDRFGKIVQGMHNRINYMIWEGFGTGKATLTADNDPQGVKFELDFGVPAANKLVAKGAATAKWSNTTNTSTADPIADLKRCEKLLEDKGVSRVIHIMNKNTFEAFVLHPKVIEQLKNIAGFDGIEGLNNLNYNMLASRIRAIFGIAPIYVQDFKATIEKDGIEEVLDNPLADYIVATVSANTQSLFSLYNSQSFYYDMVSPMIQVSSTENGLFAVKKEWSNNGLVTTTEVQGVIAPVLNRGEFLVIFNGDKNSTTGVLS